VLALAAITFAADNPFMGTWKPNVTKSEFIPGPPPKSQTVKNEAQENGLKITDDLVAADGKAPFAQIVLNVPSLFSNQIGLLVLSGNNACQGPVE
jgi:hypothetical protein